MKDASMILVVYGYLSQERTSCSAIIFVCQGQIKIKLGIMQVRLSCCITWWSLTVCGSN